MWAKHLLVSGYEKNKDFFYCKSFNAPVVDYELKNNNNNNREMVLEIS